MSVFMGDEGNTPTSDAAIKQSKDLLHRLIREQAIATREEYTVAMLALDKVTPYRDTDPEVADILKAMERTFPTMPSFGEL